MTKTKPSVKKTKTVQKTKKTMDKALDIRAQVKELSGCFTSVGELGTRPEYKEPVSPFPDVPTNRIAHAYRDIAAFVDKKPSNLVSKHDAAYGSDGLWYKVRFTSKKPMTIGEWETLLLNVHFNSQIKFHSVEWSRRQKKTFKTKSATALYHTGLFEGPVVEVTKNPRFDFKLDTSDEEYIDLSVWRDWRNSLPKRWKRTFVMYRDKKYVGQLIAKTSRAPSYVRTKVKKIVAVGDVKPSVADKVKSLVKTFKARLWKDKIPTTVRTG